MYITQIPMQILDSNDNQFTLADRLVKSMVVGGIS